MISANARRFLTVALAAILVAAPGGAAKKNKAEESQTLQLPKELPAVITGDTHRLAFYTTPLSAKGLLSQQIRDALHSLERQTSGSPILHIRAFVAGTGDLRRVRDLVSEIFTERHQPLPALSLIQAGALPLKGAQVVLEGIVNGKKNLYRGGLAFLAAQPAVSADPQDPVAPLLTRSLESLKQIVRLAGAAPADVVRITCFLSSLNKVETARDAIATEYPKAALNYVQTQRAPQRAMAACEAVAGLHDAFNSRLAVRNLPGAASARDGSQVAMVGAPHVVLTGTQASFGFEEKDARLAFERLDKALETAGASFHDVAFVHVYSISRRIEDQARQLIPAFFDPSSLPAAAILPVEGLASADAGFAIETIAAKD